MATAARDHIGPPLLEWDKIASRLRDEGMLGSGGENSGRFAAAVRPSYTPASDAAPVGKVVDLQSRNARYGRSVRWGLRAAAALLLVAGGALAGRVSAPGSPLRLERVASTSGNSAAAAGATVMQVSSGSEAGVPAETYPLYGSVDEALRAMEVAQMQYQYAASYIAMSDTSMRADDRVYRERLAALDEIAATSRAALYRAPHDPVLNQYYLNTLGAREATLRLLGGALPGSSRMARY
jgi:hypothetical protein